MKKISLTLRIPIFIDMDLNIKEKDFEDLVDEWDKSNFGIVKNIVEKYVDLNNINIPEAQERFGDTEIVDLRLLENMPAKQEVEPNTITPKGKPN